LYQTVGHNAATTAEPVAFRGNTNHASACTPNLMFQYECVLPCAINSRRLSVFGLQPPYLLLLMFYFRQTKSANYIVSARGGVVSPQRRKEAEQQAEIIRCSYFSILSFPSIQSCHLRR
jgi:hypothetical protein